jgi:hypothetical protein
MQTYRPSARLAYRVTSPPWQFDWAQVRGAMADLGIRNDVVIRITTGSRRHGSHRVKKLPGGGFEHSLTISRHFNRESASRTLWHELAHVMQSERLADPTTMYAVGSAYRTENESVGYRNNRFEIEARSYEVYDSQRRLVVPA